MATDVHAELEKQSYYISDVPDFTVRVIEHKEVIRKAMAAARRYAFDSTFITFSRKS